MGNIAKRNLSIACNAYIFVSVAYGIVVKLSTLGVAGTFTYYTQDSNLFAALVGAAYIVVTLRGGTGRAAQTVWLLRYLATCCLVITFCVSLFVLSPYPQSGGLVGMFFTPVRFTMHLTSPVLSFVSFVFLEQRPGWGRRVAVRDAVLSLVPSCIYAAFLYPLNAMGLVRGPYPFFLVREMPVWQSVLWFVGLIAAFFLIGLLVRWLANRFRVV